MKPRLNKQTKQSIKLPSIGNKTMGDISKDTLRQKERPLSSKNAVSDLEKKLFSQLQTYQDKNNHIKTQKRTSKLKNKDSSSTVNSCKQILSNNKSLQLDGMQKIAQLMPQLYNKIILSKKGEEVKPLKETFLLNNQENLSKQILKNSQTKKSTIADKSISNFNKSFSTTQKSIINTVKQTNSSIKSVSKSKQSPSKKQKKQQKQGVDSFDFAQKQMEKIYKQYLEQQGLDQIQTPINQLMDLNHDLQKCEVDIQQLQKNYQKIIKQLGNLCIDDLQQKMDGY